MLEQLQASAVRAALLEALEPITRGVLATTPAEARERALARLRIYVRPFPVAGETGEGARVIIVLEQDGPEPAQELSAGLVASMRNRAAVTRAVNDVLAVALAGLEDLEAAEGAVTAQADGRGVLMVMARPGDGAVVVAEVLRDGQVLTLGAFVDAPLRPC